MEFYRSKNTFNESPVYVSDYMSGKMTGIPAISTSVLENKICQARAKIEDSICAHCFAMNTLMRYHMLEQHLKENTEVLTERVLNDWELPKFDYTVLMVRLEAFGDTNNVIQAINYLNIARINRHVRVGGWTKNPIHWAAAIEEVGKPENLNLIYSSPRLNECRENIFEKYPFFDKVFTVYTKEYIEEYGIIINCGGKQCRQCGLCYFDNDVKYINEVLK